MKYEHLPEGWRFAKLKEFLTQDRTYITALEDKFYPRISVKWWAKGAVVDRYDYGPDVQMTRHQLAKPDQIIVSEIWAKHGSIGVIPPDGEGALITSHFFLFDITEPGLEKEYIDTLVRSNYFMLQCAAQAKGSTGYASIRPDDFLICEFPLPPIGEQQRIAEVLRDADANLIEIENAIAAAEQMRRGFLERFICELDHIPLIRLNEALARIKREVDVDPMQLYYQIGIRSHGKGIFHKEPITGKELGNKKIYWVEPGDFVLNIVFAWEGAVALVSEHERGMCGSHRFPTFQFNTDICLPEFLLFYFKTQKGIRQLEDVSPGGAGRNKTLNQGDFLKLKIPLPDLEVQQEIVASIETVDEVVLALQTEAVSLREVKRGLMQKLLSGQVQV